MHDNDDDYADDLAYMRAPLHCPKCKGGPYILHSPLHDKWVAECVCSSGDGIRYSYGSVTAAIKAWNIFVTKGVYLYVVKN